MVITPHNPKETTFTFQHSTFNQQVEHMRNLNSLGFNLPKGGKLQLCYFRIRAVMVQAREAMEIQKAGVKMVLPLMVDSRLALLLGVT